MLKRFELLRTCNTWRHSFTIGFECHTCGIADYASRLRDVAKRARCMTPGCNRNATTIRGCCGVEHEHVELLLLRDHLLSALHTSDILVPAGPSALYAREIARLECILGSTVCS